MPKLEIGHSLEVQVLWYDRVPEPKREIVYNGEVVGWRDSQVLVRVRDYAVIRFWKKNGLEVGNPDHQRRGFSLDLSQIAPEAKPEPGPQGIPIAIDTDA